jgi:hypothetical protein
MSIIPIVKAGRTFSTEEIAYAKKIVNRCSTLSQIELAQTLCEHWEWFTASGSCKTTACLGLLRELEEKEFLILPKRANTIPKFVAQPLITEKTKPQERIDANLKTYGDIKLTLAKTKKQKILFNEYLARYHYLGYKKPFGHTLRYFIKSPHCILGCLLIAGAAKSIAVRDQWIGWSRERRRKNLSWICNNTRFLIFPWVNIPHLASHALGQLARQICQDCRAHWNYEPLLLETFVDPKHYRGTCYKAANWIYLGETTGHGHFRTGKMYQTTPKMVFVMPLTKDAQQQLSTIDLLTKAQGEQNDDNI